MLPSRKLLAASAGLKRKIKKARKIQRQAGHRVVRYTGELRDIEDKLNPS